jgi:hypothetical protein
MSDPGRHNLVLAIYLQTRGFAFVLFETWNAPVDWAVHDIRGSDKNTRCKKRIEAILSLHTPDVVVLQEISESDGHRAPRIRKLNDQISNLAKRGGIAVRMYPRTELRESFARQHDATTKQKIAETIAGEICALNLYLPPVRKPWMSEHERMGIFEAAALAWMYFKSRGQTEGQR